MINIKEATAADIDIVYDLIIAIAKHHHQEQYVITTKEELLKAGFTNTSSFGILLAQINGETVGYCSYTWNYSIWQGSNYMNIDDVFVWEKFRGKKIGDKLMSKAKEVCLANSCSRIKWQVEKDNHGAIKFYERLGAKLNIKGLFSWDVG